jgi:nitrate/TMAO reductase-like tetraheme cytochrome c subunit
VRPYVDRVPALAGIGRVVTPSEHPMTRHTVTPGVAEGRERRCEKHSLKPVLREATRRAALILTAVLVSHTLLAATAQGADASEQENSCEICHQNPDFLVTNKKLYDYYQEWSESVHRQEDVTCDDCHGGDATATDKAASHGDGISEADPSSGVYYKNVVDTCGTCHDDILEGFRKSDHFEQVDKAKEDEKQGPTCVTCHGAINSEVLKVNSVADACAQCHNEETDNHPENPEKAKAILNRFLSIHRFYRYIAIRAEPEEGKAFFQKIDPKLKRLTITWHSFDLEKIDEETREVLTLLTAKRDEIRTRRKKSTEKRSNQL